MLEDVLQYLQQSEGPLSYLVLAAAAAFEYVFPPFPGDTITLFGTFLAATSGYSVVFVYASITLGSIGGSLVAYSFGLYVGKREDRWPRFLRREGTKRAIHRVIDRFERHGAVYLAINRFLPALRGVFFVAAGMARVPIWKVLVFGGVSAAVWNALILVVGWSVGDNWEELRTMADHYTWAVLGALAVVGAAIAVRWVVRRRRGIPIDD